MLYFSAFPPEIICIPRDIWQRLETFLVGGEGATGIEWAEVRDAAKHPTLHWTLVKIHQTVQIKRVAITSIRQKARCNPRVVWDT